MKSKLIEIIIAQEQIILDFEELRVDGKFTDELIASAYIQQITSRYSLAGYQCKQEHPELWKSKKTEEDRREYMKDYMKKHRLNHNQKR